MFGPIILRFVSSAPRASLERSWSHKSKLGGLWGALDAPHAGWTFTFAQTGDGISARQAIGATRNDDEMKFGNWRDSRHGLRGPDPLAHGAAAGSGAAGSGSGRVTEPRRGFTQQPRVSAKRATLG